MKFKNYEDFKSQRDALIDEAEKLLNDGKVEEYNKKKTELADMDKAYKEYAEAQADIQAMRDAVVAPNVLTNQAVAGVVASFNPTMDNDKEYRMAFMNYVLDGTAIPAGLRNEDTQTTTSDVGAVIPSTILNKIVEKMDTVGTILNKVTRTYFKGGVTVPTSSAKPVATWTTERGTTDKQKKATGSITFSYYKLRCVVAVSIAVDNVTLEVFEKAIISNIADAMVKALEKAIIAGTGAANNQPEGILTKTALAGQTVEITEGDTAKITYANLCSAEGKLPAAYDTAEWYMTKKTYFSQVVGMVDSQGQPIARVNAGLEGKPEYRIIGRPVNFVSSDDMADFASTVTADTIVAFLFRMEDYMLNTNLNVTLKKYTDEDTDDQVSKAIMLADGKVIDLNSFVTVVVKNL